MLYDDAIKAGYFHLDCEESDETGETETTPRPVVTQTRETETTPRPVVTQTRETETTPRPVVTQTRETETTPRPVVTQTRETETRGGSQTTQSGIETRLSSHKPDTQPEDGDSMVPYAVGIVFVLLVLLSLGIFIYCLRKRRSDEENSFQQPTQLSTLPTSQYEDVTPLDDDDRNGASRDYHVTRGDHSPVGVQTGSGSDDDQYGRLDRNGRKPNGAVGHSDVYGHATSPQPATSEGAEESASQQENDVYNQLRRYRKKQIVMDNVYDSTR
ncbi:hypothetical protein ACOMHN_049640 [Nucella lapillus]